MFFSLLNSTLPLFGLVLIGFLLGKFSIFEKLEANVLTKIVGVTVLPALGIKIFSNFNYEFFNFYLYFNYFFIQFLIYLSGFLVSKFYFLRSFSESIIIAMACGFSNHIFFVYPIAISEFPTKDLVPIETIIAFDFINVTPNILLIIVIQIYLGSNLGLYFKGINLQEFLGPIKAGVLSTLISFIPLSLFLYFLNFLGFDLLSLILSYAPGGQAEMCILTLSIGGDIVFVSIHHVLRVFFVIFLATILKKYLLKS